MPRADEDTDQDFAFRPWVARSCRRAMLWGLGVVALVGGVAWALAGPSGGAPVGRAFGVLFAYTIVFLATLAKIWWTARRRPAVRLAAGALAYQPLHTFRPKRVPLAAIEACNPRRGTSSLRVVHRAGGDRLRELFLNLAVIDRRRAFLEALGRGLEAHGLEPVAGRPFAWVRPALAGELAPARDGSADLEGTLDEP